jgi:membrane-bound lytic murein transglycosylase D
MATPPDATYDLHLPAGTATLFEDRVAAIPEAKRGSWRYHVVAADDTLASVAHAYRVQPELLAEVNQLSETSSLSGVTALVVPVAPEAAPSLHRVLYTVRRGDTLITISDRFGVSLADLRSWNHVTGIRVEPGRRLHVAEPAPVQQASTSRRRHSSAAAEPEHAKSRTKIGAGSPAGHSGTAAPAAKKTRPAAKKKRSKTASQEKSEPPHKSAEMAKASQEK